MGNKQTIQSFSLNEAEAWDSVVRTFKKYDVYWLSGYAKAFYIHGDGEPLLLYYEDETARGINVVMKRDVAKEACFSGKIEERYYLDIATPYGYGGWLIEGSESGELFKSYESWAVQNGIISEFVRFHPLAENHKECEPFYEVIKLGKVVHMDLFSPEYIWSNITSKNRNVIRKAEKNGVKIYNGRFPEIYKQFKTIYNSTMDKDNADKYYYFEDDFYKSILQDLSNNAQIFWAEKEGIVIAASIMIAANGYMNYHLSGSLKEYSSFAPSNLLLYRAALWGQANGYKTLYLGGGVGSGEDSLFKFKRAFYKGDLHDFYIGKKIFDNNKYQELVNMRGSLESSFFPKYRAHETEN